MDISNVTANTSAGPIMYILVNTMLKMGKGKIAAQCCHGACRVVRVFDECLMSSISAPSLLKLYNEWYSHGETKVVLKADENLMRYILSLYDAGDPARKETEIWCVSVNDAGRTQIPSGSLTVLAFRPMFKEEVPECIQKLKLL